MSESVETRAKRVCGNCKRWGIYSELYQNADSARERNRCCPKQEEKKYEMIPSESVEAELCKFFEDVRK